MSGDAPREDRELPRIAQTLGQVEAAPVVKRLPDESLRVTIAGRVYEADPTSWNWSHSEDEDAIHVALRLGGKCHLVAKSEAAR